MIKSVIDIGTNTMLMLMAELKDNKLTVISDIQRIPRLGKGVDAYRIIDKKSFEKAGEVLNEYKKIAHSSGSRNITATATSFLRDASNKSEFIDYIKENTGIEIEILSGGNEAKYSFLGAVYNKLLPNFQKENLNNFAVIDIGGGSTEIIKSEFKKLSDLRKVEGKSLDIGSVRIKEKFNLKQPVKNTSVNNAKDFILKQLKSLDLNLQEANVIGVAGSITSIAGIYNKIKEFDAGIIDNTTLKTGDVRRICNLLSESTEEEIINLASFLRGRSDVIYSGCLILLTIMEFYKINEITVSTKGLRYGIMLRELNKKI